MSGEGSDQRLLAEDLGIDVDELNLDPTRHDARLTLNSRLSLNNSS